MKGNENVYTYTVRNDRRSILPKEAVFTLKLELEMAEAEAAHRPASQVMRELMREFVQRQREALEYEEFLRHKVDVARSAMRAGLGRSNDQVEAEFSARRANAANQAGGRARP